MATMWVSSKVGDNDKGKNCDDNDDEGGDHDLGDNDDGDGDVNLFCRLLEMTVSCTMAK